VENYKCVIVLTACQTLYFPFGWIFVFHQVLAPLSGRD